MSHTWITQLRKGAVELCVLALLAREESYGYAIVRMLQDEGMVLTESTVYPALARLAREGLLASREERVEGGRKRRYYCLSSLGRARLNEMVANWRGFVCEVDRVVDRSREDGA